MSTVLTGRPPFAKSKERSSEVSTGQTGAISLTTTSDARSALNSGPGLSTSDHNAVEFTVSCQQYRKVQHAKVVYNYNQADFDAFREALSRTPRETVFLSDDDIDVVWGKWVSLFEMTVQAVIPTKRLKRRNHLPWVNREICKQIRRKRHLWKVAKDKGTPSAWAKYKKLRNWLKSEISRSRSEHITRMATQSRSNPKRFWSFMNSVLRKQGMPGLLKTPSGNTVCSSAEKADAFNRYFHSVFTGAVCPTVHSLPCASSTPLISALNIQHEEVRKELSLLNPSKSSGPDNIPARLLKEGFVRTFGQISQITDYVLKSHYKVSQLHLAVSVLEVVLYLI